MVQKNAVYLSNLYAFGSCSGKLAAILVSGCRLEWVRVCLLGILLIILYAFPINLLSFYLLPFF